MPTGYTAAIANDISFEEYALQCARAFGACLHQRDDNTTDKPKLREESSGHYEQMLLEAEAELGAFKTMTMAQKEAVGQELKEEEVARCQERFNEKVLLKNKYNDMLAKVQAWTPPSLDHVELKRFMADQIIKSIEFDCDTDYAINELRKASEMTALEYHAKKVSELEWNVSYYAEQADEEKQRNTNANQWIKSLYDSLGVEYDSE